MEGADTAPSAPAKTLVLGRVLGVYGVRGWLKVFSETDPLENIFSYAPWLIDGKEQQVVAWRRHGKGLVAQLQGYDDRDQARALTGKAISIRRHQLPPPSADECYWIDLQGLRVETREGVLLGQVSHLIETGSNDVMVVQGERERLLPFVWGQYVVDVDFDTGRVLVDWDPEF